jgi:hypothetical protein
MGFLGQVARLIIVVFGHGMHSFAHQRSKRQRVAPFGSAVATPKAV